ncbi:MAG: hypothetical protein WCO86_17015 [Planctomycetota bacterium]
MSNYQRAAFSFRNGTIEFGCALGRFSRGCTVISVVMLTAFVVPSVAAQGIRDVPGFWGLRQGNEISVLMASSRRTEIVVAGQAEVTRETSESLQIQYRVVAIERSGDVLVKAIVRKIERQPTSLILTRLTGASVETLFGVTTIIGALGFALAGARLLQLLLRRKRPKQLPSLVTLKPFTCVCAKELCRQVVSVAISC